LIDLAGSSEDRILSCKKAFSSGRAPPWEDLTKPVPDLSRAFFDIQSIESTCTFLHHQKILIYRAMKMVAYETVALVVEC